MTLRSRVLGIGLGASTLVVVACASEPAPVAPSSAPAYTSAVDAAVPSLPPAATAEVPAVDAGIAAPATPAIAHLASKSVAVPGVTAPLAFDYVAIDRASKTVWLPAGNTGSLDAYDVASGAFTRIDGMKTAQKEWHGKMRTMGPSSATVGDGVVYVGDRATGEVCAVDARARKLGKCLKLASAPDGVAYVPAAKELWVTTPHDQTITVLDASAPAALKSKTTIHLDGSPEGYAVGEHGTFYTNLEDKDRTVTLDVATHTIKSTWSTGCGGDGPRGLAVDDARGFVFVACTDHLVVLDAKSGNPIGRGDTGEGVDNIDYLPAKGLLAVAAGKAARVTLFHFDDHGQPGVVAVGETEPGARNGVVDADGNVYVPAPQSAALLVLTGSP